MKRGHNLANILVCRQHVKLEKRNYIQRTVYSTVTKRRLVRYFGGQLVGNTAGIRGFFGRRTRRKLIRALIPVLLSPSWTRSCGNILSFNFNKMKERAKPLLLQSL
jgi:hypothetical protein